MSDISVKSIDDAIFEARSIVNDLQVPYRNPDTTLITFLNTALRALYAVRPDAFIGDFSSGVMSNNAVETYYVTDLGLTPPTPFPVDDRLFFYPVVAFIAGSVEIQDDEFTDAARSAQLMASFKQQLQGA
ncbi:MAG TPA: hypothetical protein VN734_17125 [Acidobacteriaceae bacterium]|nr:hypothetical protein [Acidobacteriaceae bacterium]